MPANVYSDLEVVWLAPFVVLLLGIAVLPLIAAHWWESNRNKLVFALVCGLPAAAYMAWFAAEHDVPLDLHHHPVLAALHEYVAFVLLLIALFTITGGIHLRGTLA